MARFGGTMPDFRGVLGAKNEASAVYFLRPEGRDLVKIGYTNGLRARISGLQCGSPEPLKVLKLAPGARELEMAIHAALAGHGYRAEWFHMTALVRGLIEQIPTDCAAAALRFVKNYRTERWRIWRDQLERNRDAADQLIATILPISSHGDAA